MIATPYWPGRALTHSAVQRRIIRLPPRFCIARREFALPSIVRPQPMRILGAVVLLSLPLGWVGRTPIPAAITIPGAWLLLTLPLMFAWRRSDDADAVLLPAVRAAVTLLALGAVAVALSLAPLATGWLLAGGTAAAVLILPPASTRAAGPSRLRWWVAGSVALVAIVLWRPLPLLLGSDAPAHVTAILDAAQTRQLLPPDMFPGAGAGSNDPRYGILHGVYAILCAWTGATPLAVLRWSALFFSPVWFGVHALLMRRLGLGARGALAAAFIFTLYAGAGRGFGLGAASFPGSVAQSLCALGLAALVQCAGKRRALVAVALIALSALVHPFAWWSTTLVLGLASLLHMGSAATRPAARAWWGATALCLVTGTLVLLPRLLHYGGSSGGLHAGLNDVVTLGSGLFIADPIWVLRWGGPASVFAAPALLLTVLLVPAWRRQGVHLVGLATTLPVWLISLNPLGAPVVWPLVSYLVVRLGRIVLTTWVWVWMLRLGLARLRSGGRQTVAALLLLLPALLGLRHELSNAWLNLRQPQVVDTASTSRHLDEVAAALEGLELPWLLAAPRVAYGLRARGGPPVVLTPVAHASPNDRDLLDRLARWRSLGDPTLDDDELRAALAQFHDAALLVDDASEAMHASTLAYGYHPDAVRDEWLRTRLEAMGIPVLASGAGWDLFDLRQLERTASIDLPLATSQDSLLVRGEVFGVQSVGLDAHLVRPGEVLQVQVGFVALAEAARPERLFLRFEGTLPPAPGGLHQVSKLWRKLVLERSGRSATRFGTWVLPADLVVPARRWPQGKWQQTVEVRVPSWIQPGTYTVQPTLHDWTWHPTRQLKDYLSDRDSYTGPIVGQIRIAH